MMKYILSIFSAMLFVASTNVWSYEDYLNTVNAACSTTAVTGCSTCHNGGSCSTNPAECTSEQLVYLSGDYCYFCPDSAVCPLPTVNSEEQMLADAQQAVQAFGGELMAKFKEAMMNGGPVNTINVCPEIAPAIASEVSRNTGSFVRRVTLRTRNPQAMPDEWELDQLHEFERMLAAGTPAAELESYGIVSERSKGAGAESGQAGNRRSGERKYFRYMKAILIPPPDVAPCLACHGDWDSIDPAIQDQLNALYPHDRATGYSAGDVRGAFSVKQPID